MTRPFTLVLATALAAGCSQDNTAIEQKLDQINQRIVALDQRLTQLTGGNQRQRARLPEPDPKAVYAVPVAGAPAIGAADAPVTIVEGYEYACPACRGARNTVAQLKEKYGDKVRVVYKQFLVHPDVATTASLAACAANQQGKFEAMDRILWEKGYDGGRDFSPPKLETFAADAGLDLAKYKADLDGVCRETVMREHGELAALGQGATPTFYINGRYVLGASPNALGAVIDEELALAEKRIGEGTSRSDYYRTWVLDKGLKKFEPPKS
jgi:protein-disulfide isomerase